MVAPGLGAIDRGYNADDLRATRMEIRSAGRPKHGMNNMLITTDYLSDQVLISTNKGLYVNPYIDIESN